MPRNNPQSLWSSLIAADRLSSGIFAGAGAGASWGELVAGQISGDPLSRLRNRCVLLTTIDRFAAAAALIHLDGIARRIVLCPPDVSQEHLGLVSATAAADVIVTDRPAIEPMDSRLERITLCNRTVTPGYVDRSSQIETEWILLTSGTTGVPKLVRHTLASLTGGIEHRDPSSASIVWSTFYEILRYGGLQILLRAALTGTSLVLPGTGEPTEDFLVRAGARGVTHISGTPSHWRRALMSPTAGRIAPAYVRLSGEIADQGILNRLRTQYPQAQVSHAFASTEAGVAFVVNDGLTGFPSNVIEQTPGVTMKVEGGTLRVCSHRTASGYLGEDDQPLKDAEGYVDTGDALELRNGRFHFVGRRDGTINVGGLKVHPEEVEMVINRHPNVGMSLVRARKSPIMGTLVVADVVLRTLPQIGGNCIQALQSDVLEFCREELPPHKVPAVINFVPSLAVAETGKLIRRNA